MFISNLTARLIAIFTVLVCLTARSRATVDAEESKYLWNTHTSGLLMGLDLTNANVTAIYYHVGSDSVKSTTVPMCLVDRLGDASTRFTLCPVNTSLVNTAPARVPSIYNDTSANNAKNVNLPWTKVHPALGQVYSNFFHAFESDLDTPVILGQTPITRHHLKHAGIADVPRFWQLAPDLANRTSLTSSQLLTLYLGLLCKHVSVLASSSTQSLRVTSIMLIQSRSRFWSELASKSPLLPLLNALPASDSKPPTVHSVLIRPLSSTHGWSLLDLGECLHSDLLALALHLDQACFAAQYTKLPLSSFSVPLPGGSAPLCGPPGTPIARHAFSQWQAHISKDDLVGVSHITLSGDAWTPALVGGLRKLVGGLNPNTNVLYSESSQPHISALYSQLLQKHGQCKCGKRNTMRVRCEYFQIQGRSSLVVPAASFAENPLPLSIDMEGSHRTIHVLARHSRKKSSTFVNLGQTRSLSNHEMGVDFDDRCIPRPDIRSASTQVKVDFRRQAVQGVPPYWAAAQSMALGDISRRSQWLRSNNEVVVLADWWAVDKRWFSSKNNTSV